MDDSKSWNSPDNDSPLLARLSYDGPALFSFFPHALLAYRVERLVLCYAYMGILELRVYDPSPYGSDWDSPLIEQVYRELGGSKDPFEGPQYWYDVKLPLRLETLSVRKSYDCIVEIADHTSRHTSWPKNYFLFHGRSFSPSL